MDYLKALLFSLGLFLGLIFPSAVMSLELIYPEDGTWVPSSTLMIIHAESVSGLSIEVNGVPSEVFDMEGYRAQLGDFVKLQPEFSPGENSIVLRGYDRMGKKLVEVPAKVFFRQGAYERVPVGFRPNIMHTPQREELCVPCHNMSPTEAQLNESSAENNPCGNCHQRMLQKKYVHGPAGVFECVFCHDPKSKPSKYRSLAGDVALCGECHQDKLDDFQGSRFVHGPVAVKVCSPCHDPHASDTRAQLLLPINDLCVGCHSKVDLSSHVVSGVARPHPLKGVADPSVVGRELSCVSCHGPHGGANRVFFSSDISGSSMMLCQNCHKK